MLNVKKKFILVFLSLYGQYIAPELSETDHDFINFIRDEIAPKCKFMLFENTPEHLVCCFIHENNKLLLQVNASNKSIEHANMPCLKTSTHSYDGLAHVQFEILLDAVKQITGENTDILLFQDFAWHRVSPRNFELNDPIIFVEILKIFIEGSLKRISYPTAEPKIDWNLIIFPGKPATSVEMFRKELDPTLTVSEVEARIQECRDNV